MKETRYFYVPNAAHCNELPDEEASHASRVLRLESGDEVFLIDGEGCFFKAQLTLVTKSRCLYGVKCHIYLTVILTTIASITYCSAIMISN